MQQTQFYPNQHYSVAIDKFHYRLPYRKIFGGITQFEKNDFLAINGYRKISSKTKRAFPKLVKIENNVLQKSLESNEYWGWGGEDDDMFRRVTVAGGFGSKSLS